MKIRKFEESDRGAVKELWEICNLTKPWNDPDKDITRKMEYQPELFFVGEKNGDIVASAMAGYDGHRGSVFYLAISPSHQKQGYGSELMSYIEKTLIDIGCPKLNIVVRTSNDQVLDFYSKLSYTKDDVTSIGKRLITDA